MGGGSWMIQGNRDYRLCRVLQEGKTKDELKNITKTLTWLVIFFYDNSHHNIYINCIPLAFPLKTGSVVSGTASNLTLRNEASSLNHTSMLSGNLV